MFALPLDPHRDRGERVPEAKPSEAGEARPEAAPIIVVARHLQHAADAVGLNVGEIDGTAEMVADDRTKIEGLSLAVYLQIVNVGAQRDGLEQAVGIAARVEGVGYWDVYIVRSLTS